MNKHILTIALTGLALASFSQVATAHEEGEQVQRSDYRQSEDPRTDYRQSSEVRADYRQTYDPRYAGPRAGRTRGRELEREFDHLSRMVSHVQGELRRYGADRHIAREYEHVRVEANQLSSAFRRGEQSYNRRRLRDGIEYVHSELHHIEQELHVRGNDYYQWR